jgi:hypothetical protein
MKLLVINIQLALIEAILAFGVELKFFPKVFLKIWVIVGKIVGSISWIFLAILGVLVYCFFLVVANSCQILFKEVPYILSEKPSSMFNALIKRRTALIAMKQSAQQWEKDPRLV